MLICIRSKHNARTDTYKTNAGTRKSLQGMNEVHCKALGQKSK